MISPRFSLTEFVEAIKDKTLPEVDRISEQEYLTVKTLLRKTDKYSANYVHLSKYMKDLSYFRIFFINGVRPSEMPDEDFQKLRPIFENLVGRGFKQSVLNEFKKKSSLY